MLGFNPCLCMSFFNYSNRLYNCIVTLSSVQLSVIQHRDKLISADQNMWGSIKTSPIPWYHGMETPYHKPLIPIPYDPYQTMSPYIIPCHLISYHFTSYQTMWPHWKFPTLKCPTCRNPVIPVESTGIQRNGTGIHCHL
jgi:hypothetical protein